MKVTWNDPVRRPAKDETLSRKGDFEVFTSAMRRLMSVKPQQIKNEPDPVLGASSTAHPPTSPSEQSPA